MVTLDAVSLQALYDLANTMIAFQNWFTNTFPFFLGVASSWFVVSGIKSAL